MNRLKSDSEDTAPARRPFFHAILCPTAACVRVNLRCYTVSTYKTRQSKPQKKQLQLGAVCMSDVFKKGS